LKIRQTDLWRKQRNEWIDRRTSSKSVGADQELETMEKVERAKTAAGKAVASRNAYKGAVRPALRALARVLRV
jgi:hypothetical protein